jgi:tRNA(Ile)-lysidine synthase
MDKDFFLSMVKFQTDYPDETFAAAVSGGADSMAMLFLMHRAGLRMTALTFDHKLRDESAAEAAAVADFCGRIGVPHRTVAWDGSRAGAGVEARARDARYKGLLDYCKKNNIGVLCTAHQADDQIETFLMNLGRGSGVCGLAGIRERQVRDGIIIFRPLLSVPRAALRRICDENRIPYFDDKMNEDEQYLRVKVRKNRKLLDKIGISDKRLMLAVENLGRARDYIESAAGKLAKKIPVEFDAAILLNQQDEVRFRALSMMLGGEYPARLENIRNAFAKLDGGDCKFTLAGYNIRKLKGKIRIWKEGTKWLR